MNSTARYDGGPTAHPDLQRGHLTLERQAACLVRVLTVASCRISLSSSYQAPPLRGAGPGVSAAAQPPKARAAHAGPQRQTAHQRQLIRHTDASHAQPSFPPPIVQIAATASMGPAAPL